MIEGFYPSDSTIRPMNPKTKWIRVFFNFLETLRKKHDVADVYHKTPRNTYGKTTDNSDGIEWDGYIVVQR